MNKKSHYIFLGIFCTVLIGLQINSSAWFRLKLANFYKSSYQYVKSIQVYKKILTKNNIKRNLGNKTFLKVNFDLGHLYTKLNLTNSAIESYARGGADLLDGPGGYKSRQGTSRSLKSDLASFLNVEIDHYYVSDNVEKDKLLAIGLLEAGKWDKATKEFRRLKRFYPQFPDVEKYINTATILREQNLTPAHKNFFFSIGDVYIQNQLFKEARAFFTKRILDYGIEPLQVLVYLQKRYAEDTEMIEKVWGKDIYVTLEDFEAVEPRLFNWLSLIEGKAHSHCITDEIAYDGYYSEFFDMVYAVDKEYLEPGSTYYFAKVVDIPLKLTNPNLGIRLFINSIGPSRYTLCFNIIYPKSGISGGYSKFFRQDMGGGWEEYRVENLYKNAKEIASLRNWRIDGMTIDKIIIDTSCISTKFFVDEIELYLVKEQTVD